MDNQITSQDMLNLVRKNQQESECNIKTLNTMDTINTKHHKIKNYETSSVFAPDVVDVNDAKHSHLTSSSVGLASLSSSPCSDAVALSQKEEKFISKDCPAQLEITYLSVSLKKITTDRRTLNVDFRTSSTPSGVFNKLVFNLTDRYREFFSNIPEEYHCDWEYQECWEHYHSLTIKEKWIGKGRPRGKFTKTGKHVNQKIKFGLSACLEQTKDGYLATLWIEGIHKQVLLSPTTNKEYPFKYDSKTIFEKTEYLPRGGWL